MHLRTHAGSLPVGRSELAILSDKHVGMQACLLFLFSGCAYRGHEASGDVNDIWSMAGLNRLVLKVLSKGDKMSVGQLAEMVQTWIPTGPPRSPRTLSVPMEPRWLPRAMRPH